MAKKRGLRYVGTGFVVGVPARDLTAEEVEEYGGAEVLLAVVDLHTGGAMYVEDVKRETSNVTEDEEQGLGVGD